MATKPTLKDLIGDEPKKKRKRTGRPRGVKKVKPAAETSQEVATPPVAKKRRDPRLVGNCPIVPSNGMGDKDPAVVNWFAENEPHQFEDGGRYWLRTTHLGTHN